jgi:hypothetical protein
MQRQNTGKYDTLTNVHAETTENMVSGQAKTVDNRVIITLNLMRNI